MRRLPLLVAALLGSAASLSAVTVDGRVTGSVYAFEGGVTDSTTQSYLRSNGAVRLQVSDIGPRGLSLTTYFQSTTDLSEESSDDPSTRFYSLFLRYKDRRADVRLGRQHVWAGVGHGAIDGLRLDAEKAGIELTLFGGALVPVDGYETNSLSDAYMYGLRLQTERLAGIRLSLSYADRERDPLPYETPGIYSGFLGQPEAIRRQLLGLEASKRIGLHAVRARADVDLISETVRRGEVRGRFALSPALSVSAGLRHREPHVYSGSILSVFPNEGYDEALLGVHWRLRPDLLLSVDGASIAYDDDSSQRLGVSASVGRHTTVGYGLYRGYAGGSQGLFGSLLLPLGTQWTLRGDVDFASVERYSSDDSDGLLSGLAGLTWRPTRTFSVDAQVHGLSNPSYDSDLRFLLRGSWRFRQ